MASSSAFSSLFTFASFKKELKPVVSFRNQLSMKKMKMNIFPLKCSSSSTPTPAQKKNIEEEIIEEQKVVFEGFIEEVLAKLYLPPHNRGIKYDQWMYVTDLALGVLYPGRGDIHHKEGVLNANNIMEGDSFEYDTEREESGKFVLMENGFIPYYDVIEKKKKLLKEAAEEKAKRKEAVVEAEDEKN